MLIYNQFLVAKYSKGFSSENLWMSGWMIAIETILYYEIHNN